MSLGDGAARTGSHRRPTSTSTRSVDEPRVHRDEHAARLDVSQGRSLLEAVGAPASTVSSVLMQHAVYGRARRRGAIVPDRGVHRRACVKTLC